MSGGYAPDAHALTALTKTLAEGRVLILGDTMLDEYLIGDAERISPEAPIPVVRVEETRLMVGGAGNVARNIRSLGGSVRLISVCGEDDASSRLELLLLEDGVETVLVRTTDRPTTIKTRILARQQQMLRVDRESTACLAAHAMQRVLNALEESLADFDVLVISDYGKGFVSSQLMDGVRRIAARKSRRPLVLVDPKVPNLPLYAGVDLLTPNAKETSEGTGLPVGTTEEILRAGRALMAKLQSRRLLTTLGARGMALFISPDEVWHIPTVARKVFDVTGAGDTVIATVALALSLGIEPVEACLLANYAAGIVVGEVGAATASPERLAEAIRTLPEPEVSRWG